MVEPAGSRRADGLRRDRRLQPPLDRRRPAAGRSHARCASSRPTTATRDDRTVMAVALPARRRARADHHARHRVDGEDSAPLRAHRRHRQLLLSRPVVPEDRRARPGRHLELPPVPRRHRVLRRLRRLRRAHDRAARLAARRDRPGARATRQRRRHDDASLLPGGRPRLRMDDEPRLRRAPRAVRACRACRRSTCGCCCSPSTPSQAARHFEARAPRSRYYGEWFGPYPYGHITIVDPGLAEPDRRHGISDAVHGRAPRG